jgi:glutamine amidotransferase
MCRVLIYLGTQNVSIFDLIYGPDNSLVHQSYAPQLMTHIQNLAGFGFCAWAPYSDLPDQPFYYKTTELPFFDKNLYRLSKKIYMNCMLAHVRGVESSTKEIVTEQNAHPFKLENTQLALAHNGNLARMPSLKLLLNDLIKPEILVQIKGTTDSEWVYSLFLSQFSDYTQDISIDEASTALLRTFKIIKELREELNIQEASPLNLFLTNGKYVIVTRFVFDYGRNINLVQKAFLEYHSLWATFGETYGIYDGVYKMQGSRKRSNILFASEPLTTDRTTWIELPEYSLTKAWIEDDEICFRTYDLYI